jgi:maltodextrin utilization protein YvdJ
MEKFNRSSSLQCIVLILAHIFVSPTERNLAKIQFKQKLKIMKTLIKSLFLALSLSLVVVSMSNAKPGRPAVSTFKTGIYTSVTGKLHIALNKQSGGSVDIRLKDSTGDLLYYRHLGKNDTTLRTRLNLDNLADGDYVLEITNGIEKTSQTISIKTNQPMPFQRIIQTEPIANNN